MADAPQNAAARIVRMTETVGVGTTHTVYAPGVPGSIGVALPGIEIRVADLIDVHCGAVPARVVLFTSSDRTCS
jgi:long-subunit acyl-CoA synthetase (AMP-forming)